MSTALFRLVYCSRNTISPQQDMITEIAGILAISRINNARDGLTGALLYNDDCFAQVLEGPLGLVQQTFERIQCDERHADVVILDARHVETRMFGMWDMALAEPANPTEAKAIIERALAEPDCDAALTVVALLDGLVRRDGEWIRAA